MLRNDLHRTQPICLKDQSTAPLAADMHDSALSAPIPTGVQPDSFSHQRTKQLRTTSIEKRQPKRMAAGIYLTASREAIEYLHEETWRLSTWLLQGHGKLFPNTKKNKKFERATADVSYWGETAWQPM